MRRVCNPITGLAYPDEARAEQWLAAGAWIDSTVGDTLRRTAREWPERLAFISDERSLSLKELDETTERLGAALLQLGMAPGDRAMSRWARPSKLRSRSLPATRPASCRSVRCRSTGK